MEICHCRASVQRFFGASELNLSIIPEHSLSIIIPASNEAGLIGDCLSSLLASTEINSPLETIVVSNASRDNTAEIARSFKAGFAAREWSLVVLDLEEGGKINALNQADKVAMGAGRIYLDADVVLAPDLLGKMIRLLEQPEAVYTSGAVKIARAESWISQAYGRFYQRIPFITTGVPGCGLFAVNRAGRERWGEFPDVISDDTYIRLLFRPDERKSALAAYEWPIVEGFGNLIRVRRRQDAGVEELRKRFPLLFENDDKPDFGIGQKLAMAIADPLGFLVYGAVALSVRVSKNRDQGRWVRGR